MTSEIKPTVGAYAEVLRLNGKVGIVRVVEVTGRTFSTDDGSKWTHLGSMWRHRSSAWKCRIIPSDEAQILVERLALEDARDKLMEDLFKLKSKLTEEQMKAIRFVAGLEEA